jgi:hypothetical protein
MLEKTEDPIVPGLPQALAHSGQHKYFPPDILASWFSQKKSRKSLNEVGPWLVAENFAK